MVGKRLDDQYTMAKQSRDFMKLFLGSLKMKVIVAGYSKTGTKSMNVALTELGYKVYDFADHFWYHGKAWEKILMSGGTTNDFKQMYDDVDAVVDIPTYLFWEEIHEAFPDSKVSVFVLNVLAFYFGLVINCLDNETNKRYLEASLDIREN